MNSVERIKQKKGFKTAYKKLVETRELSTEMLSGLNIEFESFLRYSQLPPEKQKTIISDLIDLLK